MTRKMITNRKVVDCPYSLAGEEEAIAGGSRSQAFPLANFLEWAETGTGEARGVLVEPGDSVDELVPHFGQIAFVAVLFPKFTDGRGYSHARRLRKNHAFHGPIVAVGDVLRDQLMHMERCGFSDLVLREDQDAEAALEVFTRFPDFYQP